MITLRAKEDYLAITRQPPTPANLDEARDVLEAAAVDAVTAERKGQRQPVPTDSGALRYRGPKPHRLSLWVVPGERGELPQLVRVRGR